jgi:phage-related protein
MEEEKVTIDEEFAKILASSLTETKGVTNIVGEIECFINGVASTIVGDVTAGVNSLFSPLSSFISQVPGLFSSILSAVESLPSTISSFISPIISTVSGIADEIESAIGNIPSVINSAFQSIASSLGSVISSLQNSISTIVSTAESIPNLISSAFSTIESAFSPIISALEAVPGQLQKLINSGVSLFQSAASTLTTAFSPIISALEQIPGQIMNVIESIPGEISGFLQTIEGFFSPIISALEKIPGEIIDALGHIPDILSKVVSSFSPIISFFEKIPEEILDVFEKVPSLFEGAVEKIVSLFTPVVSFFEKVPSEIESVFKDVTRIISGYVKKIADFFSPILSAFEKIVKGFEEIPGEIESVFKTLPGIVEKSLSELEKIPTLFYEKTIEPFFNFIKDDVVSPFVKEITTLAGYVKQTGVYLSGFVNAVATFGSQFLDEFKKFESLFTLKGIEETFDGFISNVANIVKKYVVTGLNVIWKAITGVFADIFNIMKTVIGDVTSILEKVAGDLGAFIIKTVTDFVKNIIPGVVKAVSTDLYDFFVDISKAYMTPFAIFFQKIDPLSLDEIYESVKDDPLYIIYYSVAGLMLVSMITSAIRHFVPAIDSLFPKLEVALKPLGVGAEAIENIKEFLEKMYDTVADAFKDHTGELVKTMVESFFHPFELVNNLFFAQFFPLVDPSPRELEQMFQRRIPFKNIDDIYHDVETELMFLGYYKGFIEQFYKAIDYGNSNIPSGVKFVLSQDGNYGQIEFNDVFQNVYVQPTSAFYVIPPARDIISSAIKGIFKEYGGVVSLIAMSGIHSSLVPLLFYNAYKPVRPKDLWMYYANALAGLLFYDKSGTQPYPKFFNPTFVTDPAKIYPKIAEYLKLNNITAGSWLENFPADTQIIANVLATPPSRTDFRNFAIMRVFEELPTNVTTKLEFNLEKYSQLYYATGENPLIVPYSAIADLYQEIRTTLSRTQSEITNAFTFGIMSAEQLFSLFEYTAYNKFKVKVFDPSTGTLKSKDITIPLGQIQPSAILSTVASIFQRSYRLLNEVFTLIRRAVNELVVNSDNAILEYVNPSYSLIIKQVGKAYQDLTGNPLSIEIDKNFLDVYKEILDIEYEIGQKIRTRHAVGATIESTIRSLTHSFYYTKDVYDLYKILIKVYSLQSSAYNYFKEMLDISMKGFIAEELVAYIGSVEKSLQITREEAAKYFTQAGVDENVSPALAKRYSPIFDITLTKLEALLRTDYTQLNYALSKFANFVIVDGSTEIWKRHLIRSAYATYLNRYMKALEDSLSQGISLNDVLKQLQQFAVSISEKGISYPDKYKVPEFLENAGINPVDYVTAIMQGEMKLFSTLNSSLSEIKKAVTLVKEGEYFGVDVEGLQKLISVYPVSTQLSDLLKEEELVRINISINNYISSLKSLIVNYQTAKFYGYKNSDIERFLSTFQLTDTMETVLKYNALSKVAVSLNDYISAVKSALTSYEKAKFFGYANQEIEKYLTSFPISNNIVTALKYEALSNVYYELNNYTADVKRIIEYVLRLRLIGVNVSSDTLKLISSNTLKYLTELVELENDYKAITTWYPTPQTIASFMSVVQLPKELIAQSFQVHQIPEQLASYYTKYIELHYLEGYRNEIANALGVLFENFAITSESLKKSLNDLSVLGLDKQSIDLLTQLFILKQEAKAFETLVGTPKNWVSIYRYSENAKKVFSTLLQQYLNALPLPDDTKKDLLNIYNEYLTNSKVHGIVTRIINAIVENEAYELVLGVKSEQQVISDIKTKLQPFKKYGLSDEEIELYAQYAIVYANSFANRENAYHSLG